MVHERAIAFRDLHTAGDTFIMANAWSAGSAVLLQQCGFGALGTTSAGIAFHHALPDYEGALPFDVALLDTRSIANAVDVPVSMDAENGYGDCAEAVFENMQRIVETGVVGANIEDYTGDKGDPLYSIEEGAARIRAAKQATAELGYPFVLTARAECFLVDCPNAFGESVARLNRYREAGADCLFAPGISDIRTIAELVREVDGPINVVMGLSGSPVSLARLQDVGVSRISVGGSLARATYGLVRRAAKEMLEHGTFEYSTQQIPDAELCQLFSERLAGNQS